MQDIGLTVSNLYCRKYRDNNVCPPWEQAEGYLHIARCQGPGTQELFDRDSEDIQEWWMKKLSTQSFQDTINMLLRAALDNTDPDFTKINDDDIRAPVAGKRWNLGPQLLLLDFGWKTGYQHAINSNTIFSRNKKCPRKLSNDFEKYYRWFIGPTKFENEAEHKNDKSRVIRQEQDKNNKLPKNL